MIKKLKNEDYLKIANRLVNEQKFGESINYLQNIIETDPKNTKALILLEQLKKITEYQNRDLFGSTNLDLDPWDE
ncbi:MAG: hypothetical protein JW830_00160 [Bacteroidales bacterium]|nr:hypothetical protein [Bacteroidales bacterium]